MIEVHAPHERINGFRDFLLHLLTITIGLLIALGLEAFATHIEHNHLRDEAEGTLKRELADNRKDVASTMAQIARDKENLVAADKYLKMQSPKGSLTLQFNMSTLNNASWSTASATGALSFMDYLRVEQFANAYQRQADFLALQNRTFGDFLNMESHVTYALDLKKPDSPAVEEAKREVALTMGQLQAMQQVGKALDGAYAEALK